MFKTMQIDSLSLSVGNKQLLTDVSISFTNGRINHILGKNGIGKTCFAKACSGILKYSGTICIENQKPIIIGSYSNIPGNLRFCDILSIIKNNSKAKQLVDLLNIGDINPKMLVGRMSDGQKQKMKLLYFLSYEPKCVIFDEFTSALDKSSTLEIYSFLGSYLNDQRITSLNITHNLTDLEYLPGKYYLFTNQTIREVADKQEVIDEYVKGV
ncbi:MAG: ATP-binding cassette domain-containing protein [Clostridia bacterium]|nr:ATP-binding cassette domain-containing protein [Clostridia bacterium]